VVNGAGIFDSELTRHGGYRAVGLERCQREKLWFDPFPWFDPFLIAQGFAPKLAKGEIAALSGAQGEIRRKRCCPSPGVLKGKQQRQAANLIPSQDAVTCQSGSD